MDEHSDRALYSSLRKIYGGIRSMPRAELHRRLLMSPEFFYFADQIIEQGLARGMLLAEGRAASRLSQSQGIDAKGAEDGDDLLELAARPDLGQLPF